MNAAQRPITQASIPLHSASYTSGYTASATAAAPTVQVADQVADQFADQPAEPPTAYKHSEAVPKTTQEATAAAIPAPATPKRQLHTGVRRSIAFESSVKLTVNLLLSIVATTTIAKLIPYYQNQQQRLSTLQESVVVAEEKNAELRSQFSRNFDPAQAQHIMQEQSGMAYPNQKKVIWTAPLDTPD